MTDREYLELAAKAAGYAVRCVGDGRHGGNVVFYMEPSQLYWNPLTDDGDEARLEAALGLNILWGSRTVSVGRKHFGPYEERYQDHGGDKQAARRRAGVRAAAELGRSKE